MPLDEFKRSGVPGFPEFSVSTENHVYMFRQTGTDGPDPVIGVSLANGEAMEIRMVVTKLTHPHDWTYALKGLGRSHSFGTCGQLLGRLPFILGELENDPSTMPVEGPGLSIGPVR